MSDVFVAILAMLVSGVVGYLIAKRVEGARRFRDGYLYGFNLAWDEKGKVEKEAAERRLRELRKKRPRFQVIQGEKE